MYSREKQEIRKSHRNTPSFSSSLLDEICRSIDDKPEPQTASLSNVEKWIENDRTLFRRRRRPRCDNCPRPIRTGDGEKDRYLFDEYEEQERNIAASTHNLLKSKSKSKSTAMRIYSNLKKMKQPVSPGARLTTFLTSIFNRNKSKRGDRSHPVNTTKSPSKFTAGIQIVNNDLTRATVNYGDALPRATHRRPPLPPNAFQNTNYTFHKSRYEEEESDGDAISESSSDLFELDHSSLFGIRNRLCEELPVYETTFFHQNRRLFR
ncbi:protein BIG GRAIN 1-like A [Salvia splendens]|uniref:protein BIG GRAIN 1-like A n=1 Tax=Salvia splendens TaxID=180675 RepID=UPI0011011E0B|nr:protein BIG GRAIN 1-like A [Salvia splendens]